MGAYIESPGLIINIRIGVVSSGGQRQETYVMRLSTFPKSLVEQIRTAVAGTYNKGLDPCSDTNGLISGMICRMAYSTLPNPAPNLHSQLEPLGQENEGIFLLTLNRPEERNSIGKQMLRELRECLDHLASESVSTGCVVVRSCVNGVFCPGIDFNERENMTMREYDEYTRDLRSAITTLESLPMPTIAAIDGYALGSGVELALACDLRIGGQNAKFAFPEARLGLIPNCGGTQRLSRLIGRSRAKLMVLSGRGVCASEAKEIGLLDVEEDDQVMMEALSIARQISSSAPLALRAIKLAINLGSETELSTALKIEEACYESIKHSRDRDEGFHAFAEKRHPYFKGE
ncbi:hypothetical protein M9435_006165 [Picochlorum sp. BPE23]|nr:hypothetical protein M9435_006165 [Picochlorum sp. BPE23]